MSKRIRSGGISSMLELIWKLSPAFVGEEHRKTRRFASEFITGCSRVTHALLKISSPCISPIRFLSHTVCVPLAQRTRGSLVFFLLVPIHIRREGNPGDSAWLFFRRRCVTAMLMWYLCDTLCHITLRCFNSRVKWFNCDKWMTVSIDIRTTVIIVSRIRVSLDKHFDKFSFCSRMDVSKERIYTAI